jgi:flagellar L-ring protein precursor FlgH
MKRFAVLSSLLLAACSTTPIGQPPPLTQIGGTTAPVMPPVDPVRMALAQARTVELDPDYARGSLWRSGPQSLFGDRRARSLGDIMTVVIEIDERAEFSNSADRSRTAAENVAMPDLLGLEASADRILPPGVDLENAVGINSSTETGGSGTTRRNERLTLRIAATVTNVLPNGHLVVQGNQEVRVNYELRDLQIAGIVRPEDISRRNEITYDKIAGARIAYGGRGQITDVLQPRYGQQLFERVLPF